MTVLSELISVWNEFTTENSYPEIIYANDSFEEVVKQIYGDNLTAQKAVELVRIYESGTYVGGHRWWWIGADGNLNGCFNARMLPIDFGELNKWCIENGMDMPWTEDVELE